MAAFLALAVTGALVRWAVYVGAGFGRFEDPFATKTILYSLVPITAGGVVFLIMARRLEKHEISLQSRCHPPSRSFLF